MSKPVEKFELTCKVYDLARYFPRNGVRAAGTARAGTI
jgi:hypothetical protein